MIPIFLLLGTGVLLDIKFKLDVYTLSKLNFYIFLPTFIFHRLYEAHFSMATVEIVLCAIMVVLANYLVASIVGLLAGYDLPKRATLRNVVMFNNCGNMGVALAVFVFSNVPYIINGQTPYLDQAVLSVVSIMLIQTITSNTFGFYQAGLGRLKPKAALSLVFHMPLVYAVILSLGLKFLNIDIQNLFIYKPISIFSNAFVGIAMIALGIQCHRTPLNFFKKDVLLASFLRLIVGPILAIATVLLFIQFYGPMNSISAQAIVITYSVPTAINMALIAMEMKNNEAYATQCVMGSTVISALTMPIFIMIAYYLFPL